MKICHVLSQHTEVAGHFPRIRKFRIKKVGVFFVRYFIFSLTFYICFTHTSIFFYHSVVSWEDSYVIEE